MTSGPKPKNEPASIGASLTWHDIGRFAEALTFARRELIEPVLGIRAEHGLGPRGIWIIGLIATGRIRFQSDIAKLWQIGRSMVTEEIALLTKAGLVETAPDTIDRRQIYLSLTAQGRALNDKLGQAFSDKISTRLVAWRPEDFEMCIRLLNDLAGPNPSIQDGYRRD